MPGGAGLRRSTWWVNKEFGFRWQATGKTGGWTCHVTLTSCQLLSDRAVPGPLLNGGPGPGPHWNQPNNVLTSLGGASHAKN